MSISSIGLYRVTTDYTVEIYLTASSDIQLQKLQQESAFGLDILQFWKE
jgi:hypothetical protein